MRFRGSLSWLTDAIGSLQPWPDPGDVVSSRPSHPSCPRADPRLTPARSPLRPRSSSSRSAWAQASSPVAAELCQHHSHFHGAKTIMIILVCSLHQKKRTGSKSIKRGSFIYSNRRVMRQVHETQSHFSQCHNWLISNHPPDPAVLGEGHKQGREHSVSDRNKMKTNSNIYGTFSLGCC